MNEYVHVCVYSFYKIFPSWKYRLTYPPTPSNIPTHPISNSSSPYLSQKEGKKSKQMKNKTKKIFAFGIYWEREKSFSPMLSVCTSATL